MPQPPTRRRRKGRTALALLGLLAVLAVAALAVVYFVLFPTSSPRRFSLSASRHTQPVAAGVTLAGRWSIAPGSIAGYRVREKLGFLPAESDAVGRTSQISGQAALTQSGRTVRITQASFRINVYSLRSNEAMRDQHIHTIGIQSARYPTATFTLAAPVNLPAEALSGDVVEVPVTGRFEIHGATRRHTLPVEVELSSSTIQAVGSWTFPWGEFDMSAPSVAGFVNVTDRATLEFDLVLKRA